MWDIPVLIFAYVLFWGPTLGLSRGLGAVSFPNSYREKAPHPALTKRNRMVIVAVMVIVIVIVIVMVSSSSSSSSRSSSSSSSKARPQAPGSFLLLEWFCWFFRVRGGGMLTFTQTQK